MNGLSQNELTAVRRLKETLIRDFGLVEMKLVGSKARGDSDSESDIDVVIILRERDWKTDLAVFDLCFELGLEHDVLLQPIVYSQGDFSSSRTKITPFYQAIVREGVAL
jgi:predicted nucleotidyltransferase